uniref:Rho-GAP domain-containing protein n=1 Tax=Macrostomum lignano TaxID=282301 RepID=A0A1I8F9V5_9PLAT
CDDDLAGASRLPGLLLALFNLRRNRPKDLFRLTSCCDTWTASTSLWSTPDFGASFEQLRAEHPRRFAELCKVHLSFITDVPADFLEDDRLLRARDSLDIPTRLANKSTTFPHSLARHRIAEPPRREGLFRKAGSLLRQRQIRDCLREGRLLDSADLSCHDTASALKNCLADLPEPLPPAACCRTPAAGGAPTLLDQPLPQPASCGTSTAYAAAARPTPLSAARLLCLLHSLSADPESRMCPNPWAPCWAPPCCTRPSVAGMPHWSAPAPSPQLCGLLALWNSTCAAGDTESLGVDAARALDRLRLCRNPGRTKFACHCALPIVLDFRTQPGSPGPAGRTSTPLSTACRSPGGSGACSAALTPATAAWRSPDFDSTN